jgi:hypothetical protein
MGHFGRTAHVIGTAVGDPKPNSNATKNASLVGLIVLERHFDEHRRLYTCGGGDPEAPYFAHFNAGDSTRTTKPK